MSGQVDCLDCFISCVFCCSFCSRDTDNCCGRTFVNLFPDSWAARLRLNDTSAAEAAAAERDQEASLWQGDSSGPAPGQQDQLKGTPPMEMSGVGSQQPVAAGPTAGGRNIRDKAMIMGDD